MTDAVSTHVPAVIPRVPALQFAVFVYTLVYVASIVSWVIAGGSRTDAEEMRAIPEGARALRSLALLAVVLELIHTRWPVEQPVAVAVRAVLFVVSLRSTFTVWALILPIAHVADIAVALVLLVVGASAKLVPWGELANRPRAAYSWSETGLSRPARARRDARARRGRPRRPRKRARVPNAASKKSRTSGRL